MDPGCLIASVSEKYKTQKSILLVRNFEAESNGIRNILAVFSKKFKICAIADSGLDIGSSKDCKCEGFSLPVYPGVNEANKNHKAEVLVLLVPPVPENYSNIEKAIKSGLLIMNTTELFLKNDPYLLHLSKKHNVTLVDLQDIQK